MSQYSSSESLKGLNDDDGPSPGYSPDGVQVNPIVRLETLAKEGRRLAKKLTQVMEEGPERVRKKRKKPKKDNNGKVPTLNKLGRYFKQKILMMAAKLPDET